MRTAEPIPLSLALLALGLTAPLVSACDPLEEIQTQPFVQASADAQPRWRVSINRIRDGVFLPYRPRCFEIDIGETVEFQNFLPDVPTNVTSIGAPAPLYSPNLVWPYNYVTADDPDDDQCEATVEDPCEERVPYSYWRHTFETPGAYDWVDTNQSSPGRQVVDPYYGTVTFIGIDPNSPIGTVCVRNADGTGCEGVCCTSDDDCTGNTHCYRSEFDALGRCLIPSG